MEGGCHNMGTSLLIFHVSDHLEKIGGVLFVFIKLIILSDGGVRGKLHEIYLFF